MHVRRRVRQLALFMAVFAVLCGVRVAHAHPMGNFSVNHFSKIDVNGERIAIRYILDLAEIPTFQELQKANLTATANDPVVLQFVAARGSELARGLILTVDGRREPLTMISSDVIFPAGAGGLPTMKMGFVYEMKLPHGADRSHLNLQYADGNYEGQSGWKEIVAGASAGNLIASSVPVASRSAELSNYPTDLLNSPPQQLEASLDVSLPVAMVEDRLEAAGECWRGTHGCEAGHESRRFGKSVQRARSIDAAQSRR